MSRRALIPGVLFLFACATTPLAVRTGSAFDLALPVLGTTATDGHAKSLALSSLRGNVVLVDVWASWCEPCVEALPFYDDLQRAYGAKGFRFIGVDVDEDARAGRAFLRQHQLDDLTVLRDPGAEVVAPRLGLSRLPTALLLDRTGHVKFVRQGFEDAERATLRQEIQTLLSVGDAVPVRAAARR